MFAPHLFLAPAFTFRHMLGVPAGGTDNENSLTYVSRKHVSSCIRCACCSRMMLLVRANDSIGNERVGHNLVLLSFLGAPAFVLGGVG